MQIKIINYPTASRLGYQSTKQFIYRGKLMGTDRWELNKVSKTHNVGFNQKNDRNKRETKKAAGKPTASETAINEKSTL